VRGVVIGVVGGRERNGVEIIKCAGTVFMIKQNKLCQNNYNETNHERIM
jgi:hypothetical protein